MSRRVTASPGVTFDSLSDGQRQLLARQFLQSRRRKFRAAKHQKGADMKSNFELRHVTAWLLILRLYVETALSAQADTLVTARSRRAKPLASLASRGLSGAVVTQRYGEPVSRMLPSGATISRWDIRRFQRVFWN